MGCLPSVGRYKNYSSLCVVNNRRAASIGGGGQDAKILIEKALLFLYYIIKGDKRYETIRI